MKFAVISDIHANVVALRLVLDSIRKHNDIARIICLGDIVGLHIEPAECIELMMDNNIECIIGNHDAGTVGRLDQSKFPKECWEAILWTRRQISSTQFRFLESLPAQKVADRMFWMMHGIFGDCHHYLVQPWKRHYVMFRLERSGVRLAFYGHIHRQTCYRKKIGLIETTIEGLPTTQSLDLRSDSTYLINPGTVGQPRHTDHYAAYVVVDTDKHNLTFHSIPYDYEDVVRRTLDVFPTHRAMYQRLGTAPG